MTAPITSALRRQMTDEGARVTADRDEFCAVCDAVDSIHARKLRALDASTRRVDELCKENERLRGLVRDMMAFVEDDDACERCGHDAECVEAADGELVLPYEDGCLMLDLFADRTRELEIEVDGA